MFSLLPQTSLGSAWYILLVWDLLFSLLPRPVWEVLARLVWEVPNCPCDICPCPYLEYLSCYLPDFDETLNVVSWEHLEQIPIIKLTFVLSRQHLPWGRLSISGISRLLLTWCWTNFRGRFLEPSHRLNFDQTLKVDYKKKIWFMFLEPDHFTQNFCSQNLLDSKLFWTPNFLEPMFFWTQTLWDLTFFDFFWSNTFRHKVFRTWFVFGSQIFWTYNFFWQKQQQQ